MRKLRYTLELDVFADSDSEQLSLAVTRFTEVVQRLALMPPEVVLRILPSGTVWGAPFTRTGNVHEDFAAGWKCVFRVEEPE